MLPKKTIFAHKLYAYVPHRVNPGPGPLRRLLRRTPFTAAADGQRAAASRIPPGVAPARLSPEEQRDYLRWHYWDRFDFADTLFVREADTAQMVEAYARWVALISDRPADAAPMDSLMRRASASRPMLDYFTMLAQQVIHDPNSPLRNDEFYIPVMQAVLASPYYDEYERIGPAYDLAMASQNRLGQRATISAIRSPRAPRVRSTA